MKLSRIVPCGSAAHALVGRTFDAPLDNAGLLLPPQSRLSLNVDAKAIRAGEALLSSAPWAAQTP